MRIAPTLAVLAAFGSSITQAHDPPLEPGEEIEAKIEGDLNADGLDDVAYVVRTDDTRRLAVLLSYRDEVNIDFELPETTELEPTLLGPASLSIERDVLKVEDLTGGTTAINAIRRYRYDRGGKRLRLIGLDATLYSRTFAHDGFELSWNLLTGDLVTRELTLSGDASDAAYDSIVEHRRKRRSGKVWLADSPDPHELIFELQGD
jgi:hypothetical protein